MMIRPTAQFRWLRRPTGHQRKNWETGELSPQTTRVLQQWWADERAYGSGEWRDVPVEDEADTPEVRHG